MPISLFQSACSSYLLYQVQLKNRDKPRQRKASVLFDKVWGYVHCGIVICTSPYRER